MELFGTPPSLPLPFLEDLENISPKSPTPPPLEPQPFEAQSSQQQPKPMLFHPIYKDIHGTLYGEPNFQQNDQPQHQAPPQEPQSQSQHFESLFPSYEEIEESLWNNPPNTNEEINNRLDNLYAFKSMIDTHLHQTTSVPPSQQSTTNPILPNSRHDCSQCERTIKICESIKTMLHQVQDETRFILQNILEHLNALSHHHHP